MNAQADIEVLPILVIIGLFWWMICSVWNEIQSSQSEKRDRGSPRPYGPNGPMMAVAASDKTSDTTASDKTSDKTGVAAGSSPTMVAAGTTGGLAALCAIDDLFDIDAFLGNSRLAYEAIVLAFAGGDRGVLRPLLSDEVFAVFDEAINRRAARGETQDCKIVCVESAEVDRVVVIGRRAEITVNYVGQFVTVTRNASGAVIDGNPHGITTMSDAWTFARDFSAELPAWTLIATDTP